MKKAILFDLDGTLLNTDLLIKKSFIHTFKKYKPDYTLSEEELLSFLGPSLKNTFSRYVENNQVDELIQYYRDYNHKHHEDFVTIYPNVKEMLEYLKKQNKNQKVFIVHRLDRETSGVLMFCKNEKVRDLLQKD